MDILKMVVELFRERLLIDKIYVGLILAIIGVALGILARRLTRVLTRKNEITNDDKTFVFLKAVALMLIFAALIIMIVKLG